MQAVTAYDGAIQRVFRKTAGNCDQLPITGPNKYVVTLYNLEHLSNGEQNDIEMSEVDIEVDERLWTTQNGGGLQGVKPTESGDLWL